jgi:hypothetical protein
VGGGKQIVSVGKIKRMNEGQNFCKITIMAGSASRTSMCTYKNCNIIKRHNVVMGRLCHELKKCSTLQTTKEASEPKDYLQTRAVDR